LLQSDHQSSCANWNICEERSKSFEPDSPTWHADQRHHIIFSNIVMFFCLYLVGNGLRAYQNQLHRIFMTVPYITSFTEVSTSSVENLSRHGLFYFMFTLLETVCDQTEQYIGASSCKN
jgi:hypothetical protein